MRKNQFVHYILIAWAGFIVTAYNACGGFNGFGSGFRALNSGGANPVPVFEKTLHPLLVEHCSACHAQMQAPLFAMDTVEEAWKQAKGVIDLANPSGSRVIQKLLTEAHNCWGDCEENAGELLTQVEEMKKQLSAGQDDRVSLGVQEIPGPGVLPDLESGSYQTFEWSLAAINLPSATFAVDIQEFGIGAYRFENPRFENLPVNLRVRGLAFKLNGSSRNRENTYYAINIEDTELSDRRLSSAPMQVVMEVDGEGNPIGADLEPVFDVIESIDTTPRLTPTFSDVMPMLTSKCISCHGGNNPSGGRNFQTYEGVMEVPLVPVAGMPQETEPGKPSVVPGNFVDSLMYQSVSGAQGAKFMPQNGSPISQREMDTLTDWILGGALQ